MPLCPTCGVMLTSTEWTSGTCPTCASRVGGPPNPPETAWSYVTEKQDVAISGEDRLGWGTVRTAFGLIAAAGIMLFASAAVILISLQSVEGGLGGGISVSPGAKTLVAVSAIGILASVFIACAGMVMCSGVPRSSGCRGWAWGATLGIVLMFASVIAVVHMANANDSTRLKNQRRRFQTLSSGIGGFQDSAPPKYDELPWEASTIEIWDKAGKIIAMAAHAMFLLFLWSVSRFLNQRRLALTIFILFALTAVFDAFATMTLWSREHVGMFAQLRHSVDDLGAIGVTFVVFGVGLAVWYLTTLILLRINLTRLIRDGRVS